MVLIPDRHRPSRAPGEFPEAGGVSANNEDLEYLLGSAAMSLAADQRSYQALTSGVAVPRHRLVANVLAAIGEPLEGEPLELDETLALRVEATRKVDDARTNTAPRSSELASATHAQSSRAMPARTLPLGAAAGCPKQPGGSTRLSLFGFRSPVSGPVILDEETAHLPTIGDDVETLREQADAFLGDVPRDVLEVSHLGRCQWLRLMRYTLTILRPRAPKVAVMEVGTPPN
jgi:hypothetical protein